MGKSIADSSRKGEAKQNKLVATKQLRIYRAQNKSALSIAIPGSVTLRSTNAVKVKTTAKAKAAP